MQLYSPEHICSGNTFFVLNIINTLIACKSVCDHFAMFKLVVSFLSIVRFLTTLQFLL